MSTYILRENFMESAALITESSERASYPFSNAEDKFRRAKVYRTNGVWEITATNNELVFEETNAVPLTATVAVATYTSTTAMLTALKAALEVAGASTYTCSVDVTTGKIKITSNGSGGGGILNLRTSNAGSTIASVLGFDTAIDRTGSLTYTADLLRITTGENIVIDHGVESNPKALILIGKRNSPIGIAPSATLNLYGNQTNIWTSPQDTVALTHNDLSIVAFNADGLYDEARRYSKIAITDLDNPLGYIELSYIYLGDAYTPTRGRAQFPFESPQIDYTTTVTAEGGNFLSDIRPKTQSFNLRWFALTKTEKEEFEDIFDEVGTGIPFFVIVDPDAEAGSTINEYTRFVRFTNEPTFSLERPNLYTMDMRVREEL